MTWVRTFIAILFFALWALPLGGQTPIPLRIHFVDVGQGDGVLIQSPSGQNVVYDAGENATRMRDYLTGIGVSQVGLAIASHNHADHIGGLPDVLARFRPQYYMDSGIPATTLTYQRVLEAVKTAGSQLLEPTARRIALGDVSLRVVPPPGIPDWDQNDNSIGLVVEYGSFRLSMAGDAEPREWRGGGSITPTGSHPSTFTRRATTGQSMAILQLDLRRYRLTRSSSVRAKATATVIRIQ